jgi:hypothetical protein
MMTADLDSNIPVPVLRLVELAVEAWRLERWLVQCDPGQSTAPIRYAARRISEFLRQAEFETRDLTGSQYEPGLAIEILDTVRDPTLSSSGAIIDEMISPICLWRGVVVRHGQAVIRSPVQPDAQGETA